MQSLDAVSKTTEWSLHFQDKPYNTRVIKVYGPTNSAEEAELEWFYEDLQDLLEQTPNKKISFSL